MTSLLGAGNHGQDIQAIYRRCDLYGLSVFDDDPATGRPTPPEGLFGDIIIGVNDPSIRRQIAERFSHLPGTFPLIDPTAVVGPDVVIGRGCVINPFVSLLHSVALEDHVHVNTGAQMVRTTVGAYSTIAPGAIVCGNVDIGEECMIGAGAVICERVAIGNRVTIGAGAVIPPRSEKIPDDTVVVGVWKGL
jgi:acetyltransferase-like isoleucine patch superfamily enzyme